MTKNVIGSLASSLGVRGEAPNQLLARQIVNTKDRDAIEELVENLSNKDKNVQSDCVKVLYEIGEHQPDLIAAYDKDFLALLDSPNNRLVWGAMTALDCIAGVNAKGIYKHLAKIMDVAERGSVITKDHGVNILVKLASVKQYADSCLSLLIDQLKHCATNQLPMYAENALPVITDKHKKNFSAVLTSRLKDVEKESKRKRIEKVLKKVG